MPTRTEAEEHLRIIRSLMEKATIYRAISAPTALAGGLLSVVFGGIFFFMWMDWPPANANKNVYGLFVGCWLVVLLFTSFVNGLFIRRAARLRNEPFISPAMRKALWALLPPMVCGGVFTTALMLTHSEPARWSLPEFWMLFYGLGLLATAQFAPKSIPLLGWCFVVAGLISLTTDLALGFGQSWERGYYSRPAVAHLSMIATFGLFHLIYAACTWPRKSSAADSGVEP